MVPHTIENLTSIEKSIAEHLIAIRDILRSEQPESDYYLSCTILNGKISFHNAHFESDTNDGKKAMENPIDVFIGYDQSFPFNR